jgi:hypothetical protein
MGDVLVNIPCNLQEHLKDRLGNEIEFGSSFITSFFHGKYKGKEFYFSYEKNNYLIFTISVDGKEELEELRKVLTTAMGNNEPVCYYDLLSSSETDEQKAEPTYDWDVKNPQERMKNIVNGTAFSNGQKCLNIKLTRDIQVADLIETDKSKIKISGVYPGYLTVKQVEEINNYSEAQIYHTIKAVSSAIWSHWHATKRDDVKPDFTESEYGLQYIMYLTKKFGVELSEPEIGRKLQATPTYVAWYNWWDIYFQKELSADEWDKYQQLIRQGKDVSMYRPSGDWKANVEKPIEKVLTI